MRVTDVPEEDRDTLRELLELDPWPDPRPPATPLRLATREEIDVHWHGAPATDDLYRARWSSWTTSSRSPSARSAASSSG